MTNKVEESEPHIYDYKRRKLYFSAIGVYTLFMATGVVMGWASPALPKLDEEHFNMTNSQESLLASITNLAPGPLITIFGIDTIGRKPTLLVIWLTIMISAAIMLISQNIYALLVARFIAGLGMGASFSAIGIFVSEISDVKVRSALNTAGSCFLVIGGCLIQAIGPQVSFLVLNGAALGICSVFGFFYLFLPESPYYHIKKGNIGKARASLSYLRAGATQNEIDQELAGIQYSIEEERKNKSGLKKLFTSHVVYKQFAFALYLLYLQQGSGQGPLMNYLQKIFDNAGLDFNGAYVPIFINFCIALICIPSPFILRWFGSRQLLLIGGFGSGISMVLLGLYFVFLENGSHWILSIRYASIAITLCAVISVFCGLGGIVWATISDLFAPSVKGTATGVLGILSTLLGFVAIEIFGEVHSRIGFGPTFLGFGVVQVIASIGIFFLIDISKMTLQEIQDHFEGKSKASKGLKLLKNDGKVDP